MLSVWVDPAERALLKAAAVRSKVALREFIRLQALEAAEEIILRGSIVTILVADWEKFEAWVERPAVESAALAELVRMTPT